MQLPNWHYCIQSHLNYHSYIIIETLIILMDNPLKGNGFKIVSVNIHSVLRHLDELFLTAGNADIICLQETWLHDKVDTDPLLVDGFQFFRQDRNVLLTDGKTRKQKKGGGILIYIRNSLSLYTNVLGNIGTSTKNCEQLWLQIARKKCKNCILGVEYRPPSASLSEGITEIESSLNIVADGFQNSRTELVLLGDFNVNYAKPNDPDTKKLKEIEKSTI